MWEQNANPTQHTTKRQIRSRYLTVYIWLYVDSQVTLWYLLLKSNLVKSCRLISLPAKKLPHSFSEMNLFFRIRIGVKNMKAWLHQAFYQQFRMVVVGLRCEGLLQHTIGLLVPIEQHLSTMLSCQYGPKALSVRFVPSTLLNRWHKKWSSSDSKRGPTCFSWGVPNKLSSTFTLYYSSEISTQLLNLYWQVCGSFGFSLNKSRKCV